MAQNLACFHGNLRGRFFEDGVVTPKNGSACFHWFSTRGALFPRSLTRGNGGGRDPKKSRACFHGLCTRGALFQRSPTGGNMWGRFFEDGVVTPKSRVLVFTGSARGARYFQRSPTEGNLWGRFFGDGVVTQRRLCGCFWTGSARGSAAADEPGAAAERAGPGAEELREGLPRGGARRGRLPARRSRPQLVARRGPLRLSSLVGSDCIDPIDAVRVDCDGRNFCHQVEKQRINWSNKNHQSEDNKNEYAKQLQKANELQKQHYQVRFSFSHSSTR